MWYANRDRCERTCRTRGAICVSVLSLLSFTLFLPPATAARSPQQPQARGQQQLPGNGIDNLSRAGGFSASVEMVRVPVVVEDNDGVFIQNLEAEDFEVRDGGKNHAVDFFVSDAEPLIVGILVDASEAMKPYADDVGLAIENAANNLRPDDEIFLITYGPSVAMLTEPTADKLQVISDFADYTTWDGADRALYDALDLGLSTLERSAYDKRSLLVIGAGGDTASNVGELGVQQHIHRTGVTIHAIILSQQPTRIRNTPSRVNRLQTLPEIVTYTGGLRAQRPRLWGRYRNAAQWFESAGTVITTYMKHQYLLHYAPQNPPRPGTWRSIRVVVEGDPDVIRARSGYVR